MVLLGLHSLFWLVLDRCLRLLRLLLLRIILLDSWLGICLLLLEYLLLDGLLLRGDRVGWFRGGGRWLACWVQRLCIFLVHLVHLVLEGHHLHVLTWCRRCRLLDLGLLLRVRVLSVLGIYEPNSLNSRHKFRLVLRLHRSIWNCLSSCLLAIIGHSGWTLLEDGQRRVRDFGRSSALARGFWTGAVACLILGARCVICLLLANHALVMPKVPVHVWTLAWLHNFDSLLLWLQNSRVLAIFRVSSRQPWWWVAICDANLSWLTLNEVVHSHHFYLRGTVILFDWERALSWLSCDLIVLLPQQLCQLVYFSLLAVQLLLSFTSELGFLIAKVIRVHNFEFFALFLKVVNFLCKDLDVEFELLLDFDMIANFGLINL